MIKKSLLTAIIFVAIAVLSPFFTVVWADGPLSLVGTPQVTPTPVVSGKEANLTVQVKTGATAAQQVQLQVKAGQKVIGQTTSATLPANRTGTYSFRIAVPADARDPLALTIWGQGVQIGQLTTSVQAPPSTTTATSTPAQSPPQKTGVAGMAAPSVSGQTVIPGLKNGKGASIGGKGVKPPVDLGGRPGIGSQGGVPSATGKIPGAGQGSHTATTTATPLPDRPGDGKKKDDQKPKVGVEEFFSREKQLKELSDPARGRGGSALKEGMSGEDDKAPGRRSPDVGHVTITPGEGKNEASRRSQASEGSSGGTQEPIAYPNTGKSDSTSSPIPVTHGDAAGTTKETASSKTDSSASEFRKFTDPGFFRNPGLLPGTKKTPNPETDTGDGHKPKALQREEKRKSPDEVEAERRRQVTQPGEDQSRPIDRDALKQIEVSPEANVRRMTGGKIDPAESDGTTTGGAARRRDPKQIDQHGPSFGGAGTTPGQTIPAPRPGDSPDDPTESTTDSEGGRRP